MPDDFTPKPTTVFGVRSPWSGDERDPIPWTYRALWFPTYRATRRIRHRLHMHDWRPLPIDGGRTKHCDWCGARRKAN